MEHKDSMLSVSSPDIDSIEALVHVSIPSSSVQVARH
jgi:hypothetical protein